MRTKDIIKTIGEVVVLPPAIMEAIEKKLSKEEEEVTEEYMNERYNRVEPGKWEYNRHYLRIARYGKMVTPTVDCSVTFWVVTMRDLAEAVEYINGSD